MRHKIFLFFLMLISINGISQSIFHRWFNHPFTACDTNYIQPDPDHWSLRLNSTYKFNNYPCKFANSPISYTGKTSIGFGAGFSFRNFVADVAVKTQPYHTTENVFINALKTDMVFSMYNHQHLIDGQAQFYDGYVFDPEFPGQPKVDSIPLKVRSFGLHYEYAFNFKRFSMTAAMVGNEIQKHSAGSFLFGGIANSTYFLNDTSSYTQAFHQLAPHGIFHTGVSAGYAYTLVLPAHMYVMCSATPAAQFAITPNSDETRERSWSVIGRTAIGINLNHIFAIASSVGTLQQDMHRTTRIYFNNSFGRLRFVLGYRFY